MTRLDDRQRAAVVVAARSLVGVRFVHAGRSRNGLDCVGLLVTAATLAGLHVYDNRVYSRIVDGAYMVAELAKACAEIDVGSAAPADVLLMAIGNHPQHVALVAEAGPGGPLSIIHAYQSAGMVVEHEFGAQWRRRTIGAYELRCG